MTLKFLLPYENFTLATSLQQNEIKQKLSEQVMPKRNFFDRFTGISHKLFEGYVFDNHFKISRIIKYRNSFLPIITGNTYLKDGKVYINVEMKVIEWILIVSSIIIAIVSIGIGVFNNIGFPKTPFVGVFYSPWFILPFWYLVILLSFKYESSKAKKHLKQILNATEV